MNNTRDNTGNIIIGVIVALLVAVGIYYLFFSPSLTYAPNVPVEETVPAGGASADVEVLDYK